MRWGVAAVGGIAVLALGLWLQPWRDLPVEVRVEVVEAAPLSRVLAVNGRVEAATSVKVRSPLAGEVLDVFAREGERVDDAQPLLQLDDTQARAQLRQAISSYDAAVLRQMQAQANVDRARALGATAPRRTLEDAELALSIAQSDVSRLKAAMEQARDQLSLFLIRSPAAGTLLSRNVEPGQVIDTQTNLFTVADMRSIVVEADVDELYAAEMTEGLPARLRPTGMPSAVEGRVSFVAPSIDSTTGGRRVRLSFDEPLELPVGLTVEVNIVVEDTDSAISVPRGAVVGTGDQAHVLISEGGVAMRRPVSVLDWPAERLLVTNGLAPGDRVILDPTGLADGEPVREARD